MNLGALAREMDWGLRPNPRPVEWWGPQNPQAVFPLMKPEAQMEAQRQAGFRALYGALAQGRPLDAALQGVPELSPESASALGMDWAQFTPGGAGIVAGKKMIRALWPERVGEIAKAGLTKHPNAMWQWSQQELGLPVWVGRDGKFRVELPDRVENSQSKLAYDLGFGEKLPPQVPTRIPQTNPVHTTATAELGSPFSRGYVKELYHPYWNEINKVYGEGLPSIETSYHLPDGVQGQLTVARQGGQEIPTKIEVSHWSAPEQQTSAALHEINHAVAALEGLPSGDSMTKEVLQALNDPTSVSSKVRAIAQQELDQKKIPVDLNHLVDLAQKENEAMRDMGLAEDQARAFMTPEIQATLKENVGLPDQMVRASRNNPAVFPLIFSPDPASGYAELLASKPKYYGVVGQDKNELIKRLKSDWPAEELRVMSALAKENPRLVTDFGIISRQLDEARKVEQEATRQLETMQNMAIQDYRQAYLQNLGEVEARAVQRRFESGNYDRPFWKDYALSMPEYGWKVKMPTRWGWPWRWR